MAEADLHNNAKKHREQIKENMPILTMKILS